MTAWQIESYQRNGFVNGGKLIDEDAVERLREELTRVLEEHQRTEKSGAWNVTNLSNPNQPVIQVVNIWMASQQFQDLMLHPDLGIAAWVLMDSKEVRIWHDQIQSSRLALVGSICGTRTGPIGLHFQHLSR